jgi:hypothetical protein
MGMKVRTRDCYDDSVLKKSKHYHCQQRDELYGKEKRMAQEIRKRLVKVFRDASRWKTEGGVRDDKERVYLYT